MRDELKTKLLAEFPDLYETLQYKQFECSDGWYDIIHRLSTGIANIISQNEDMDPKVYTVFQVKEKFGGLRFYMSGSTDEIHQLIAKAEEEAERTCEMCGGEGKLREGTWLVTLCDACEASRHQRQ